MGDKQTATIKSRINQNWKQIGFPSRYPQNIFSHSKKFLSVIGLFAPESIDGTKSWVETNNIITAVFQKTYGISNVLARFFNFAAYSPKVKPELR